MENSRILLTFAIALTVGCSAPSGWVAISSGDHIVLARVKGLLNANGHFYDVSKTLGGACVLTLGADYESAKLAVLSDARRNGYPVTFADDEDVVYPIAIQEWRAFRVEKDPATAMSEVISGKALMASILESQRVADKLNELQCNRIHEISVWVRRFRKGEVTTEAYVCRLIVSGATLESASKYQIDVQILEDGTVLFTGGNSLGG